MSEELQYIVRVAGYDLPGEKSAILSLTKVKGVSAMYANAILSVAGLDKKKKIGYYTEEEVKKLEEMIKDPIKNGIPTWLLNKRNDPETGENKHLVSNTLDAQLRLEIEALKRMQCYRGVRHMFGLRVRGQRTKSTGRRSSAMGVSRKKIQPATKK